jgi:uncharacterized protein involved in tolerance to divalent cations
MLPIRPHKTEMMKHQYDEYSWGGALDKQEEINMLLFTSHKSLHSYNPLKGYIVFLCILI